MPFPALNHVAVTVRDLEVSGPWYRALLETEPVLDEHTDAGFHHLVWAFDNGTLFGIHQHDQQAPDERFTESRVGLDHVGFGCANRAELEGWVDRLEDARHRAWRHRRRELRLWPEFPRPRRHRIGVLRAT